MSAFILVHLNGPAKHLFMEELDFTVGEIFERLDIYAREIISKAPWPQM